MLTEEERFVKGTPDEGDDGGETPTGINPLSVIVVTGVQDTMD